MNNTTKLGNFISEYSVRNRAGDDIPVYSVTNKEGFCRDYFSKDVASQERSTYKIVPRGCFAYNPSRINVGSVDWQRKEDRVIVSPLYVVFSVSKELDQQYLYYYLKSEKCLYYIKELASGSVRDNLKLSMLKEFTIPNITLEEQRKAVTVLEQTDRLITLQERQMTVLDELVKSRFVEMFGEQKANPKGLPVARLSEVTDISLGLTHTPTYVSEGKPFLSVRDISSGIIDFSNCHYITDREFNSLPNGAKPREGDILFCRVGTIGKPVVIPKGTPEFGTFVSVGYLRKKDNMTNCYLKAWMEDDYFMQQVLDNVSGASQINLNTGWLKNFQILLPDLEMQTRFEVFCNQVDKSKLAVKQSLEKLETLKKSLMQQYFG